MPVLTSFLEIINKFLSLPNRKSKLLCAVMLSKLISIAFAVNIVLCSVGVQVMHHDCLWCGGDRVEVVSLKQLTNSEDSCCTQHGNEKHHCDEDGCCEPKLLKLTKGLASDDGFDFKRVDTKPFTIDVVYLLNYAGPGFENPKNKPFKDSDFSNSISPPVAFLAPLRC